MRYPAKYLHVNYFSSACDSAKMVSPFRSVTVSAISLCLVSSSLMLLMRGASRDNLVLLALSSSSLLCSSIPLLFTARRQSLYSVSIFFRCSRKDFLAKSSSADSNLATMHDGAPVCRVLAVLPHCFPKCLSVWQMTLDVFRKGCSRHLKTHSFPIKRRFPALL